MRVKSVVILIVLRTLSGTKVVTCVCLKKFFWDLPCCWVLSDTINMLDTCRLPWSWFDVTCYGYHVTSWAFRGIISNWLIFCGYCEKLNCLCVHFGLFVTSYFSQEQNITPIIQVKASLLLSPLPSLSPALCSSSWPTDPAVDSPTASISSSHSHCLSQSRPSLGSLQNAEIVS